MYAKSKNGGFIYVFAFTPELWTLALPHRTQILFSVDIAQVVAHLSLRPGSVVVESGTGSGSLTASLARAVAPSGHVYTFEFNADRALKAKNEFAALGLSPIVTVTHADACTDGFGVAGEGVADGVFLDLPQPWLALPYAKRTLRQCGVICSFSPCIEQVQRTAAAMRSLGFDDVRTIESLLRPYDALPYALEQPKIDWRGDETSGISDAVCVINAKRRRLDDNGANTGSGAVPSLPNVTPTAARAPCVGDDSRSSKGELFAAQDHASQTDDEDAACRNVGSDADLTTAEARVGIHNDGDINNDGDAEVKGCHEEPVNSDNHAGTDGVVSSSTSMFSQVAAPGIPFVPYPKSLESRAVGCRPGAAMRGHTGFLTYVWFVRMFGHVHMLPHNSRLLALVRRTH